MSEISAANIIHRANEKEYITGYWQKRSAGFANLRKAELAINSFYGSRKLRATCRRTAA